MDEERRQEEVETRIKWFVLLFAALAFLFTYVATLP